MKFSKDDPFENHMKYGIELNDRLNHRQIDENEQNRTKQIHETYMCA